MPRLQFIGVVFLSRGSFESTTLWSFLIIQLWTYKGIWRTYFFFSFVFFNCTDYIQPQILKLNQNECSTKIKKIMTRRSKHKDCGWMDLQSKLNQVTPQLPQFRFSQLLRLNLRLFISYPLLTSLIPENKTCNHNFKDNFFQCFFPLFLLIIRVLCKLKNFLSYQYLILQNVMYYT